MAYEVTSGRAWGDVRADVRGGDFQKVSKI